MIKTGRVGRIIIACLMTVVLTVVGVHINKKTNALAFTTNAAVISDILGKDVGDVTKDDVTKVVNMITAIANMPANRKVVDGVSQNIVDEYNRCFGSSEVDSADVSEYIKMYCKEYETYLYGDGEFTVFCNMQLTKKSEYSKYRDIDNGVVVCGSLNDDGTISVWNTGDMFEQLMYVHDSIKGDAPSDYEENTEELIFHDPAEDFEDNMTEEERQIYEEEGTLTFREDPEDIGDEEGE